MRPLPDMAEVQGSQALNTPQWVACAAHCTVLNLSLRSAHTLVCRTKVGMLHLLARGRCHPGSTAPLHETVRDVHV